MTLRALFTGCWFRHEHVRARNPKGESILRCMDCGDEIPLLQSEVLKGPKHQPDRVVGERTEKAKIVREGNIHEWKAS